MFVVEDQEKQERCAQPGPSCKEKGLGDQVEEKRNQTSRMLQHRHERLCVKNVNNHHPIVETRESIT